MRNKDAYKKMVGMFGEKLTNEVFPELGLSESIIGLSAISQRICEILVFKNVITEEEYHKFFSDKEMEKMKERLYAESEKVSDAK